MIKAVLPNGTRVEMDSVEEVVKLDSMFKSLQAPKHIKPTVKDEAEISEAIDNSINVSIAKATDGYRKAFLEEMLPLVIQYSKLKRPSKIKQFSDDFVNRSFTKSAKYGCAFDPKTKLLKRRISKRLQNELGKTMQLFYNSTTSCYHDFNRCYYRIAQMMDNPSFKRLHRRV